MKTKIKIILSALLTLYTGWQMDTLIGNLLYSLSNNIIVSVCAALVLFIAWYLIIGYIYGTIENSIRLYKGKVNNVDIISLFIKFACIIAGLCLGNLLSIPFLKTGYAGILITLAFNSVAVYCGYIFSNIKGEEIKNFVLARNNFEKSNGNAYEGIKNNLTEIFEGLTGTMDKKKFNTSGIPKILDTSVIIDGRIYDLCKSGFIEGELIIPSVVLEELRHIADSSDTLKRNRGRRGLDVLKNIQSSVPVRIEEVHMTDGMEVDSVLLKLAKKMNAKVITNDYNLNKVAAVQEVEIFNINELANAIKPILLPGEEMEVRVMKDGKENGQGIAYLEDGTMIVVEGGKYLIGKELPVIVTSVLQTAAGRMIFAKPKEQEQVS